MTRTPLDVGAVVGFSRSSWSRLSCIFRSSQSASERNHCSACARGNWAPTTGSVFANPVSILCRSLGNNRPSTYRRNPSRWLLLPNNASKCFTYSSNGAGARATSIRFVNFFSASSALILPSFSPRQQTTGKITAPINRKVPFKQGGPSSLYALRASDGAVLWHYQAPGDKNNGVGLLAVARGLVYIATTASPSKNIFSACAQV